MVDTVLQKLQPLIANMYNEFDTYKAQLTRHIGVIIMRELKRIAKQRLGALGFEGDEDEDEVALEPQSNLNIVMAQFNNFKAEIQAATN